MDHKPEDYDYSATITVDEDETADYTVLTGLDTPAREKFVDQWLEEPSSGRRCIQRVFQQDAPAVWRGLVEECGGKEQASEALDRIAEWFGDKWQFIHVSVEIKDGVHVEPIFHNSVGGIENDTDYYKTVISELVSEGLGQLPENLPGLNGRPSDLLVRERNYGTLEETGKSLADYLEE